MKKIVIPLAAIVLAGCCCRECGTVASAKSPDGRNAIEFNASNATYRVMRDGIVVAGPAAVSLRLEGRELGAGTEFKGFCNDLFHASSGNSTSMAARAAFCSARFLLEPMPRPTH